MESTTSTVEEQRLENIRRNGALLKNMGIHREVLCGETKAASNRPTKRRKIESVAQPSRSSARISSAESKSAYVDSSDEHIAGTQKRRTNTSKSKTKSKDETAESKIETTGASAIPQENVDVLRAGWASWGPTALPPSRDEDAVFHFPDQPSFLPNKSPEEMIREGCFGGSYFRPLYSRKLGITISDDWRGLPGTWVSGLDVETWLVSPTYNQDINKYKVSCGQSIEEWEAAGWINHTYDVRGWFQWYCRFFMGRRCEDDERQISRWRKCIGETGRWRRMLLKKYVALGIREVFDDGEDEDQVDVSPVMHQTCAHWAFEVRQNVLDEYWKTGN
jgi:hypothetical protein